MVVSIFCRTNDGRVTGGFPATCCKKHGKEAETKDFNLAEEGSFPCKLCCLGPSEQEFHGE